MDYELKYIKYKNKYIELKNQIGGKLTDSDIEKLFFNAGIENDFYKIFTNNKITLFHTYIEKLNDTEIKNLIKYIAFILMKNQKFTEIPDKMVDLAYELRQATYIAVSLNIYWGIKNIDEIKKQSLDIYKNYCVKDIIQDAYIKIIFEKYGINDENVQDIFLKSLKSFKKTNLLKIENILELYMEIIRLQTEYKKTSK
jgi:hypothetical protein